MDYKKCSNVDCSNPTKNENGLLPATLEYFYADKRRLFGLRPTCKYCKLAYFKQYRNTNKVKVLLAIHNAHAKKIDYYRKAKNVYYKQRLMDPKVKIVINLCRRLRRALKGINKTFTTKYLIGCTPEQLRKHLESKFQPGMNWDNYGCNGWHIDHIKPCKSFDLTDLEQQKQCFNYLNLQPLWKVDNLKKGSKIERAKDGSCPHSMRLSELSASQA